MKYGLWCQVYFRNPNERISTEQGRPDGANREPEHQQRTSTEGNDQKDLLLAQTYVPLPMSTRIVIAHNKRLDHSIRTIDDNNYAE
mgnify:FL=1